MKPVCLYSLSEWSPFVCIYTYIHACIFVCFFWMDGASRCTHIYIYIYTYYKFVDLFKNTYTHIYIQTYSTNIHAHKYTFLTFLESSSTLGLFYLYKRVNQIHTYTYIHKYIHAVYIHKNRIRSCLSADFSNLESTNWRSSVDVCTLHYTHCDYQNNLLGFLYQFISGEPLKRLSAGLQIAVHAKPNLLSRKPIAHQTLFSGQMEPHSAVRVHLILENLFFVL